MDHELLTDSKATELAEEVNRQLRHLAGEPPPALARDASGKPHLAIPEKQQTAIEEAIGEPVDSFWEKYKRAARKDLCDPNGLLYQQWHRWKDLQSKDVVKVSYGILTGLGVSGLALPAATIAAAVLLLNILTNIGIRAICEESVEEKK